MKRINIKCRSTKSEAQNKTKQGKYKIITKEKAKNKSILQYVVIVQLTKFGKNSGLRICINLTTWNMSTSSSISIFSKTRLRATKTPLLIHPSLVTKTYISP